MGFITKKILVLVSFFLLWGLINSEYLAETPKDSIINLFCIESFKVEMLKANLNYDEEIAKDTCDCYLEEFINPQKRKKLTKTNFFFVIDPITKS